MRFLATLAVLCANLTPVGATLVVDAVALATENPSRQGGTGPF
ncbi:hypothetical protein [Psychrobacillus sp. OK028]|nr:hypothetical protein [Psychrobacillus sp. OK028]